ncbi:MAG: hypothetical protein AAF741_17380 [Bacteroidota bacterium]
MSNCRYIAQSLKARGSLIFTILLLCIQILPAQNRLCIDKDAFRLISAGWNEMKRQEQTGTIRIDDLQIERNKLINRLLVGFP